MVFDFGAVPLVAPEARGNPELDTELATATVVPICVAGDRGCVAALVVVVVLGALDDDATEEGRAVAVGTELMMFETSAWRVVEARRRVVERRVEGRIVGGGEGRRGLRGRMRWVGFGIMGVTLGELEVERVCLFVCVCGCFGCEVSGEGREFGREEVR